MQTHRVAKVVILVAPITKDRTKPVELAFDFHRICGRRIVVISFGMA